MGFNDDLADESKVRRENKRLRSDLAAAATRIDQLESHVAMLEAFEALNPDPPKWQVRAERKKSGGGIAVAMLSDLHLDELVSTPVNSYDRRIANERIAQWADLLAGLSEWADGLVILWGGDMVTGEIHPELARTNEDSILGTTLFWSEILAAALNLVAERWGGRVKVYCTYGNHGRLDPKMQFKDYVRRNYDWWLAHSVARITDGLEWHIPEDIDCPFEVHGSAHVLTHGNHGFSGGGGIGGIWPPILRGVARLQQQYITRGLAVRHVWMGHWHTATFGAGFTINGTTKGPDEFSESLRLAPEPPSQVVELWTPRGREEARRLILV